MKLACEEATTPTAWDSERGGMSSRERTGAREEKSFNVCFAFRRFLLGASGLGFFCLAAIGRYLKRRRKRGAAEATKRWWRMMENDASDMLTRKTERESN